jgi:hypothetical protein
VNPLHPDPVARSIGEQINKRLLDGGRDEATSDVKVADEPAKGQLVHQRHDGVGNGGQRQRQRHEEAK